ncbi:MAG: hypothetical protein ACLTN0_03205 [Coprococcus phoceensis]
MPVPDMPRLEQIWLKCTEAGKVLETVADANRLLQESGDNAVDVQDGYSGH